ncbi:MAG: hypothetical protein IPK67_09350 [Planctomycetes bacterium]|nr:hypothetical protein [Planctomycetota bacterium]
MGRQIGEPLGQLARAALRGLKEIDRREAGIEFLRRGAQPTEDLDHQRPQGEEVGAWVGRLAEKQFRGDGVGGARDRLAGQPRAPGEAEVRQARIAVGVDDHVAGLEVAVDESRSMQGRE